MCDIVPLLFGSTLSSWLLNRYEEAKAKGVHNFDRELEDVIERLIVECERKIQRAVKRLEEADAKAAVAISVSEVTQVLLAYSLPIYICIFM